MVQTAWQESSLAKTRTKAALSLEGGAWLLVKCRPCAGSRASLYGENDGFNGAGREESVELKNLIRGAHSLVEAKEKRRVTQEEMAKRIGVGHRTYMEYQRGTNAPLAMKAILNLLNLLDEAELVKVVREWKGGNSIQDAGAQHQGDRT